MIAKISALLAVTIAFAAHAAHADVVISNKPTQNMNCDAGVCTATAQKAVLNVGELQTMLASGDVAVKTESIAKDIDIAQPLTWSSTSRLTFDAQRSVTVKKQITVAGQGALTVTTNDSGASKKNDGEFIIVPEHGSVQFWDLSSSLIIDGNSYTLVGDIKTLATDIAANPSGFYALAKSYNASHDGIYAKAPISTDFTGIFEGLGNTISNLSLNVGAFEPYGFFAYVGTGGVVRNLILKDETLKADHVSAVGLLAGGNEGSIRRCRAIGSVKVGGQTVGGLVGVNFGTIVLSHADAKIGGEVTLGGGLVGYNEGGMVGSSYATGSIALRNGSLSYVGGLVGENGGSIPNTYALNRVKNGRKNNNSWFGGLIGKDDSSGQISNSYAAGEINVPAGGVVGFDSSPAGSFVNAYWDLDDGVSDPANGAANIKNDPGITGLTDTQLKSGLPAGFDPKVWASDPNINNGYPYLLANPPQ